MKLTQKWVNGSCDNYDQNSNKNESQCNQATTTTTPPPHPEIWKETLKSNKKKNKQKTGGENSKPNQMCNDNEKIKVKNGQTNGQAATPRTD